MARKILVTFTAFIWLLVLVGAARGAELTIEIEDVHVDEGMIMLSVHRGEAEFKGESQPIASFMARAQKGPMAFSATLPAGTYAVRVMHDVNGNGELDANFVGIPSEPWGMSNNAAGNFGPPSWADSKFELDDAVTQTIKLRK